MIFVTFVFLGIWACRYVKAGPNQVLIVSGRQIQLADGRRVGFRIVKGGGTFVVPIIEKVDVLSLEVLTIEIPKCKVPTAKGATALADCVAQVKIRGDDVGIYTAIEQFLSKKEPEIKNIIWLVVEKHLRTVLGGSSVAEISQDLAACAARVEAAASEDLANMGVAIISFTIRDVRSE
jgi:flotillin